MTDSSTPNPQGEAEKLSQQSEKGKAETTPQPGGASAPAGGVARPSGPAAGSTPGRTLPDPLER